jgi:hypothetical protein
VTRNDCNRCCCGRSLRDGLGSFVPRMSSRRPENAHSRRGSCAAIGSLTARAGFLPKPRPHSLQNLCASSLSSRLQVAHLIMAALHHTNLSSPWHASPPPSSSAIAPTHARSPLPRLGSPAAHERKGSTRRQHRCSWGWGGPACRASRWPFDGPWQPRAAPPGRATPREFVVFENNRCWKLVRDQLWMASGRTSRRRRLPRLWR